MHIKKVKFIIKNEITYELKIPKVIELAVNTW